MNRTKVVFIQKNWEDNIGILSIVALLKKNGFQTDVFVAEKGTYEELKAIAPDIVGYSCYTGEQTWIFSSIRRLREAGISAKVLVGGPHATFFPDMIENPLIDIICRGEGEYPVLEYAEALEHGEKGHAIQNLYFRTEAGIVRNPLRPLIQDLDVLPFPDRTYYDRYPFLASNPYKIFITGRGCPYQCTFCFNHALYALYGKTSRYVRRRSVENVIAELAEVRDRWGIDHVRFSDDHFALNAAWLREFAPRYRMEIGRPFTVNARVDVLDEEKIGYLKQGGCRLLCFGIETGREEIRNSILKKNITDAQIFSAARLLKKYGIPFLTSNIIGLPGETPEDAWQTIGINQKIGTNLPWFSMMQYYPGTEIHREALERGIIGIDFSVDNLTSYFENSYLHQEFMDELQNIHSFSIICSRFPSLEPLSRFLAKRFRPNRLFKLVFKISYLVLTLKRANFSIGRLITGCRFYLRRVTG